MASAQKTMLALKARGPNDIFLDAAAPIPTVRSGYLLIKVTAVALNPTDWKRAAIFNEAEPHTIGCDVAGSVVSCGDEVEQDYKPGDRVAGLCFAMKPGDPTSGGFGQYALLKGALSLRIPDQVSYAEAATMPVGINFTGQALYQTLKLPLPSLHGDKDHLMSPAVLIYGGATATGMFALQFARLSGCRVLTTCSPRNFQLVKALGAHEVFDYHDTKACASAIREATGDSLLYALDCVSAGSSLEMCANALTSKSGTAVYTSSLPLGDKFPRQDVQHGWTSGYTSFGETTHLTGKFHQGTNEDLNFAAEFWKLTAQLLGYDRLRLGPLVHHREGGLAEVINGLTELKAGHVSAGKLVYTLQDN